VKLKSNNHQVQSSSCLHSALPRHKLESYIPIVYIVSVTVIGPFEFFSCRQMTRKRILILSNESFQFLKTRYISWSNDPHYHLSYLLTRFLKLLLNLILIIIKFWFNYYFKSQFKKYESREKCSFLMAFFKILVLNWWVTIPCDLLF
jgi:hypothetical protein